jgi:hypothetical protein
MSVPFKAVKAVLLCTSVVAVCVLAGVSDSHTPLLDYRACYEGFAQSAVLWKRNVCVCIVCVCVCVYCGSVVNFAVINTHTHTRHTHRP